MSGVSYKMFPVATSQSYLYQSLFVDGFLAEYARKITKGYGPKEAMQIAEKYVSSIHGDLTCLWKDKYRDYKNIFLCGGYKVQVFGGLWVSLPEGQMYPEVTEHEPMEYHEYLPA